MTQGMKLTFKVNGRPQHLELAGHETLLDVLRNDLNLTGTKEGCREGECGACTVLVNGRAVDSCIYAAMAAQDTEIETVEGLAKNGGLNSLQNAFAELGGVQCGFCTPGFLMMLTALLNKYPQPDRGQVRDALSGNICRCTGYTQIEEAVERYLEQGTDE